MLLKLVNLYLICKSSLSGLTAVRSEDVLDVMFNDFPSKFDELQRLLRERKENEMKERGKGQ